ncbi:MAG: hypothetical protein BGN85_05570 [Alphaproteobacteria bacterium 64-11]|nr:hypothetical protein [Alphaproteobacteria bacterium]OJU11668.1 MAG: hypothetical protein BGN85_05570 [Alphaproteobacteria bacterium 64-11]
MSASAPVDPGTIMYTKDWLTLIALVLGPILAVAWTLHHQDRKERRSAKERLFIQLMAHRKSIPISLEWAQALNVIDVVYADHPKVVERWHDLYDTLCTTNPPDSRVQHERLELLSEMAKALGYGGLQQTDIDKFYVPDAHAQQAARAFEVQTEFLRVLKASKNMAEGKPGDGPAQA